MTTDQIHDLFILQQTYLSKVQQDDKSEQIRIMELIYYWIRKQITAAQVTALSQISPLTAVHWQSVPLTPEQRAAFGFLQIKMISAWKERDIEWGCEVELEMRRWIDRQIDAGVSHAIAGQITLTPTVKKNIKKN